MAPNMLIVQLLAIALFAAASWGAKPAIPTFNGKTIDKATLQQFNSVMGFESYEEIPDSKQLRDYVFFKMVVEEAKKTGLDKDTKAKLKQEKILYELYLDQRERTSKYPLLPNIREVEEYYSQRPLLRIRHLMIWARNPQEEKAALAKIKLIIQEYEKTADFAALVVKYSEDETAKLGGEFDNRGAHNLSEEFYSLALGAKENALAGPLTSAKAVHLIQVLQRKPLEQAPAAYLEFLRQELRQQRSQAFKAELFQEFRKNAKPSLAKELDRLENQK